jgi:hypothetical protein
MAKVYNMVGSYTVLMDKLQKNGITGFRSVDELLEYYKQIDFEKSCVYAKHKELLLRERVTLPDEIQQSAERVEKVKADTYAYFGQTLEALKEKRQELSQSDVPFFIRLLNSVKRIFLDLKIKKFESTIDSDVAIACEGYHADLNQKVNRLSRLTTDFDNAVSQSCAPVIREFDRHKSVILGLKPYIYGAIGELKVANTLRRLPESCTLINDLSIEFATPLYFKQEDQYISSVQIDHLLITQAGVFVIETKNWSERTASNDVIFSPINQVRRAGFALYVLLSDPSVILGRDHLWGTQKIPVRNLVVFTGHKPLGEFQYVKVLGLNELEGYVKYFKPIYSVEDAQLIADYFVNHFVDK